MRDIVRYYTREAGVRNLEREICQDLPQGGQGAAAAKQDDARKVDRSRAKNLDKFLGVRRFTTAAPRRRTRSARSPASRGPKSAASC